MKPSFSEKGQALILLTFGIIALMGFTALAVDGGRVFSDRRHAQSAVDAAALSAALAKANGGNQTNIENAALSLIASNGYDPNSVFISIYSPPIKFIDVNNDGLNDCNEVNDHDGYSGNDSEHNNDDDNDGVDDNHDNDDDNDGIDDEHDNDDDDDGIDDKHDNHDNDDDNDGIDNERDNDDDNDGIDDEHDNDDDNDGSDDHSDKNDDNDHDNDGIDDENDNDDDNDGIDDETDNDDNNDGYSEPTSDECRHEHYNDESYIQVIMTSYVDTSFARVVGINRITNVSQAITHVQSGTSSSNNNLFNGAAMVATKSGNSNQCFLMNGSANLYTHNSGIYVNCSGSQALFINGGADLQMDAMGQVVGCYKVNGNASYDPITCSVNGGVSQTINETTFANVPTTLTPPTCNSNGNSTTSGSTITFTPGNFTNITINSGKTAILTPGTYCISGSFNLNGNAQLKGPNGKVQLVLQNQNITLNGGGIIDFNDLEIYGNNASFILNGGAIFRANRLRMFSTGNGTFTVNGSAELSSGNAYFYLNNGNITWNGNSILNLHAPPQGDPFAGLLVHMPWNSTTSGVVFNGGSTIDLYGTFLAPRRPMTFNGGVDFELHSQIIGYTYIVNGGGDVDIYFLAEENYNPPNANSPSVELTK